jgi:predicted RNA binding protein YcfA (HicA-like mRNA interferase family)
MTPKMLMVKSREMIRALERAGFYFHHQTGSHYVMKKEGGFRAVVPVHGKDLKKSTINSILREARISRDEFFRLL